MTDDLIRQLYRTTQAFVDKVRSIGMERGSEERDQLLDFVDACYQYMIKNPI
jgi:hypothetical protein